MDSDTDPREFLTSDSDSDMDTRFLRTSDTGMSAHLWLGQIKLFSLVWNFEKQDLRKKFKIEEALYAEMFQNFIKNKNVCTFIIRNFNDNL